MDYELTPIGPGNAPYPADGVWAEPSVEHAARLMREIFGDQKAARGVGERAARDIASTHSLEAAGRSMKLRLDGLRARLLTPWPPAESLQPENWPPMRDESRSLRSRATRYLARHQLHVLYEHIGELHKQIAELRIEQQLDTERTLSEVAVLQAEILAALRRHETSTETS